MEIETKTGRIRPESAWEMMCKQCGSLFIEKNYNRKREYCSRECYSESKKGFVPWNKGTHMWADKPHPRGTLGKPSKMKGEKQSPETCKKNSEAHRGLKYPNNSGENHHFWRGGITPENEKQRKSAEYSNWRRAVFERDSYTCQECHKSGGHLHAHHIEKFSDHPDLRFDPQNGETLCMKCHAKKHGLVFSLIARKRCPDCGKRIKMGAKHCLPCRMKHTQLNRNKCVDCGAVIQRVSVRCRSCAAKINIIKTGHVDFWRYKKCNTRLNVCQSASLL